MAACGGKSLFSHATSGRKTEASWEKQARDLGKPLMRVCTLHPTFLSVASGRSRKAQTRGSEEGGTGPGGLRSVPGTPILLSPVSIGIGVWQSMSDSSVSP